MEDRIARIKTSLNVRSWAIKIIVNRRLFYCSQTLLNYLAFQSFGFEVYLTMVIPERRCAQQI
jgi:hypothetical protein